MAPALSRAYSCITQGTGPRAHLNAAPELHDAGVWVGYLDPTHRGESYKGLPSFNELKNNFKKFKHPYPTALPGVVSQERSAICRGCHARNDTPVTLRELGFTNRTKLVVLPLVGENNKRLFCILDALPNDRSLSGIQAYRPYEIREHPEEVTNNFMFLAPRNSSQSVGALVMIRETLNSLDGEDTGRAKIMTETPTRKTDRSSGTINGSSAEKTACSTATHNTHIKERAAPEMGESPEGVQTRRMTRATAPEIQEGQEGQGSPSQDSFSDISNIAGAYPDVQANPNKRAIPGSYMYTPPRKKAINGPNSAYSTNEPGNKQQKQNAPKAKLATSLSSSAPQHVSQENTDGARSTPSRSSQERTSALNHTTPPTSSGSAGHRFTGNQSITAGNPAIALNLTEDQAKRVYFVWTFVDKDDIETEYVRSLLEGPSLNSLMNLLREDSQLDPDAETVFSEAKGWRMLYQFPNGPKRAMFVRLDNETAFDRLKDAIAQAPFWTDTSNSKLEIELRPVRDLRMVAI
ncbi:hypothetical protein K469DRAFT_698312 [Zopfia rhizophila CBS 207.26]|uniref:Uncharacterized protein n=1 Tax=Zopfia rhizophila CBS 207.26 TaxID=1314779 RepID=A0A6A6DAP6_9PEZI|nr:hypothetical protein K469DRAFT_698312 [Zopfia rhizophila CBS 207.26]